MQVLAPGSAARFDVFELLRCHAVRLDLALLKAVDGREPVCEPLPVEAGVRAFGELEEAFVRVLARSADAVHVEVVAGLAAGEQGGRLIHTEPRIWR